MAFATIYREFLTAVLLGLLGEPMESELALLPNVEDGLSTMRLVQAAVTSHELDGARVKVGPAEPAELIR